MAPNSTRRITPHTFCMITSSHTYMYENYFLFSTMTDKMKAGNKVTPIIPQRCVQKFTIQYRT
jgi:hypothetical protein